MQSERRIGLVPSVSNPVLVDLSGINEIRLDPYVEGPPLSSFAVSYTGSLEGGFGKIYIGLRRDKSNKPCDEMSVEWFPPNDREKGLGIRCNLDTGNISANTMLSRNRTRTFHDASSEQVGRISTPFRNLIASLIPLLVCGKPAVDNPHVSNVRPYETIYGSLPQNLDEMKAKALKLIGEDDCKDLPKPRQIENK